jgi:hypothetical protein
MILNKKPSSKNNINKDFNMKKLFAYFNRKHLKVYKSKVIFRVQNIDKNQDKDIKTLKKD